MIKPEGRGFDSHPGQSFPLSLCGPISTCRANAHMVYGLKHQHFTSHSITLFVRNISATRRYVANATQPFLVSRKYCSLLHIPSLEIHFKVNDAKESVKLTCTSVILNVLSITMFWLFKDVLLISQRQKQSNKKLKYITNLMAIT